MSLGRRGLLKKNKKPINIELDEKTEIATICGVKYSYEFFRMFADESVVGKKFKIGKNSLGSLQLEDWT